MSCLCVSCNRAHLCHQVRGLIFDNVTGCFKDSNDRAFPKRVPSAARNYALMTTCTNLAVQDKSAGFCIEARSECEMPNPGSDSESFWKAASSKGQSTHACDPSYPNGGDWTMVRQPQLMGLRTSFISRILMPSCLHTRIFARFYSVRFHFFVRGSSDNNFAQACYELQKPGLAWFSDSATFKTYESLRTVVPVLPFSNYAWKITGCLQTQGLLLQTLGICCRGYVFSSVTDMIEC